MPWFRRSVLLVVTAALALPPRAHAERGLAQALSELGVAPAELTDVRRPLSARLRSARALGRFGPARDAVQTLLDALAPEHSQQLAPELRDEILLALARRAAPEAGPRLSASFEHTETPSPALLIALAAVATPETLAALANGLERPRVAADAERALLLAGERAALPLANAVSSLVALRATRILGRLGPGASKLARPALARALTSESPELRAAAAEALGQLSDRRSAPLLVARLKDPAPEVVSAALRALALIASQTEAEPLVRFYRHAAGAVRPLALVALAAAAPVLALPALERATLDNTNEPVLRDAALSVLEGERIDPSFAPLLGSLFARELRRETASALARVPDGAGIVWLLGAAQRSPDALDRAATALALGLRRFDAAVSGRMRETGRTLLRSLPPGARRLLLSAIARDPRCREDAERSLGAKAADERATAALALAALDARDSVPKLRAALEAEHDGEAARRELDALRELGAQLSFADLFARLTSDETAPEAITLAVVQRDAARSAPEPLRRFLRRALASTRPPRVRVAAALGLAALADEAARPALAAVLDDGSARVRLAATQALARLGGRAAVDALEQRAHLESDALVRESAHAALRHAGVPAPAPAPGELALELRVLPQAEGLGARPLIDVLLDDGRWLRLRPLASGELVVLGLPEGRAEVRAID